MTQYLLFVVLIFTIIIFIAVSNNWSSAPIIVVSTLSIIFVCALWMYLPHAEEFVSTRGANINIDDLEQSDYNNISTHDDIDSMRQRILNPISPGTPISGEIDNSDVVAQVVQRGNTVFQPNGIGVTPTISAEMSKFSLGGPSGIPYLDDDTPYDIPQVNVNSLDETIARKQAHTALNNKKAIDGHVRSTRNIYQKYFTNELNENSDREWWGNNGTSLETDFSTYDINIGPSMSFY